MCPLEIDGCPQRIETLLTTRITDLETLLREKIDELDKRFQLNSSQVQNNTVMIAASLEKRLDSMNEFRLALSDGQKNYYSRPEHDLYSKAVEADLRILRESRAELTGMARQSSVLWAFAFSIISAALAIGSFIVHVLK